MADGKVVIEIDLDSFRDKKGLSKIGGLAVKGLSVATGAITGTATALGGVSIAAIKAGSDFESQMSRVQAISGATGSEFNKLKEQAIQLGADTAFSSSQAAEGMENLAAAGFIHPRSWMRCRDCSIWRQLREKIWHPVRILRLRHCVDLVWKRQTRRMWRMYWLPMQTDTNSSVADTGEAMKYVAPLARAAGLSIEETAAAIGIMANAGIPGIPGRDNAAWSDFPFIETD